MNIIISTPPPKLMEDTEWKTVAQRKRTYPTINRKTAFQLQKELDIEGLCNFLMSQDIIDIQRDGWRFRWILKGNDTSMPNYPPEKDQFSKYRIIPIENKWNDSAVFTKRL